MQAFIQYVVGGLGFGGIYALAALGLVLINKTSGVVNFAFGAMATVITLILWSLLVHAGLPFALAWVGAMVFAGMLGGLTELVLLRRIERSPLLVQIVLTLGLLILIEGLAGTIWGYAPKAIPQVLNGNAVSLGSFLITPNDLFIVGLTVAIGIALYAIFERTRSGLAMRAIAADREIASLMGVRTRRYITASWAAGVALSGVSAILVAPTVGLEPTMMDNVAVFAFAAAILGGFSSLPGAVVGGFLIGIVSNLIAAYVSTNLQQTLIFGVIVVLLYVRPQGLFGAEATSRV
ncbi:MAG: branched-chain amino acid ABC transporter permease [Solirubrobacteraceae bacterium]